MSRSRTVTAAVALALAVALAPAAHAAPPPAFQNPGLPVATRVADLLSRLTLDEKITLLHQYEPAIPRLGIKAFKTGTEAVHGVAWTTEDDPAKSGQVVKAAGTVFPQAPGLASTWDVGLLKRVGSVIGDEARGYNATRPGVWGLQLWAPVVNLLRDPRWGRNEEGYSEDPYLTGRLSTAVGQGMQGDDPDHLKTAPVLKHYLANNNEDDSPGGTGRRDTTSSDLRPRVEREYDQRAFSPALSADAATGVMASYNLVNGRPTHVDSDLDTVVRPWSGRELFNVSDAGVVKGLAESWSNNYFAGDYAAAAAAMIKAGVDSFTVDDNKNANVVGWIKEALTRGLLAEGDVDTAAGHILSVRTRLGDFDPDGGPYAKITPAVIDSAANRKLNREVTADAMVLLKNSGGALPLKASPTSKVAVVGPLADTLYTDWYGGNLPYGVTPLAGIKARAGSVAGADGADRIALKDLATGRYLTAPAVGGAVKADGLTAGTEQQFDTVDWGGGVLTLKAVSNGRYLTGNTSWQPIQNTAEQPNGWYVQEQFGLERQDDGSYLLRYSGYETEESWWGPNVYVRTAADGSLSLTTKDAASRFGRDLVRSGVDEAVAAAKSAGTAVVVIGSNPFINGREDHDRKDLELPASQVALVKAVKAANPHTVVVLENSYPTAAGSLRDEVPALLWTTHGGAETGNALADVLFGSVDPSGRLAQTWYRDAADLPDIMDYDIIKSGRTYLYYRGEPLFPFGYGLSYTSFSYGRMTVDASEIGTKGTVHVSVPVTNTGTREGSEVVQLYSHQRTSRDARPVKELRDFEKISLKPGRTRVVNLRVKASDFAHWDVTRGRWVVERSVQDLMAGSSSGDIRATGTVAVQGETIPARNLATATRAIDFDDYEAVRLLPETLLEGDAVGVGGTSLLKYADAALAGTVFTAKVASTGTGEIKVRLDAPDGPVVATVAVPDTGGVYAYQDVTAPVTGATGRHDVYLTFTGDFKISTFSIK
ncbi:glycoside hydrolase family 3 protein [Actinocorallia longicatena]|uniref:Glycoside hydrolase family 3 protein n=1 Tax=Actinocorallia longicatena TaxID=111803 RepID=A0ABP6QDA5_9ACTN